MQPHPLIARAIEALGTQKKLADAAGVEQQTISKLLNGQRRITAEMAVAIERATAGQVPRQELRPDIFKPASADSEAA